MNLRPVVSPMTLGTSSSSALAAHSRQLNGTSLQVIYKYDLAAKVPFHGEISFAHLANLSGLQEVDIWRVVRFASSDRRVFQEKRASFVSHSAASKYLAESDEARAALGFMFDECYQSFAHTVEALERDNNPRPGQSVSHVCTCCSP